MLVRPHHRDEKHSCAPSIPPCSNAVMLDLTEVRTILSSTPAALRQLAGSVSGAALEFRESPDAWTVREVLCHLADGEIADWIPRIGIILSNRPETPFAPFDREAGFDRYCGWSAAALLDEFDRLRAASVTCLSHFAIGPADLARTGIHPEFGPVTLEQLIACWVTHDFAHLAQISRILVRHFGREVGPWSKYFSLLR